MNVFNIEPDENDEEKIEKQQSSSSNPSNWIAFIDKNTKRVCYYNVITEQQRWEKPKGIPEEDIPFTNQEHLTANLTDPEGLDDDFAENEKPFMKPNFDLAIKP